MRKIHYVSCSTVIGNDANISAILVRSRQNNAIDGITGVLWTDGRHFMQVIEGPKASVAATFARIQADVRHHHITVLENKPITAQSFGTWSMAHRRRGELLVSLDVQMRGLLQANFKRVADHFFELMEDDDLVAA